MYDDFDYMDDHIDEMIGEPDMGIFDDFFDDPEPEPVFLTWEQEMDLETEVYNFEERHGFDRGFKRAMSSYKYIVGDHRFSRRKPTKCIPFIKRHARRAARRVSKISLRHSIAPFNVYVN